ncbi:MAG: MATE family efflux transporter [Lachnospiraceae bacterium]
MTKVQTKNPLGYQSVGKLLLRFALPAVVSMLVNAVYNIVDQIFIGQGVGYLGNAATTIAFPIVTIILAISTMLGSGGSSYAAIKLGEKKEEEAEKTLGTIFLLLLGLGILLAVLGLVFLDPMLKLFGATNQTMHYARQYTSIILIGAPFNMLGIGLSNMARTDGNPALAMYSIVIGAVLNTILDPIYIFVFHWGVVGAAIATITSQIISVIILFHYFVKKGNMRLTKKNIRVDKVISKSVFILGISSGITQISGTILQIVLNNSLVYYGNKTSVGGDVALSAMGIVMKVSMIIVSICIGIGIGSQPILGFNKGARQYKRIKKTYLCAAMVATLCCLVGWATCQLFPGQILSIFGTQSAIFTQFAIKCMRIFMMGIFVAGFQVVTTSYFQATGQPIKASILSMMRQLILLIPLILILPLFFGLDGILYAGPIADFTTLVVVLLFAMKEMKHLH